MTLREFKLITPIGTIDGLGSEFVAECTPDQTGKFPKVTVSVLSGRVAYEFLDASGLLAARETCSFPEIRTAPEGPLQPGEGITLAYQIKGAT